MKKIAVLTLCLICLFGMSGCKAEPDKSNHNISDKIQQKETGLYKAELSEREEFYLTADNELKQAYDLHWNEQSISKLVFRLYQFEDDEWKEINKGTLSFPQDENIHDAWLVLNADLTDFHIQMKTDNSSTGHHFDSIRFPWKDEKGITYDTIENKTFAVNEEFAVVAYWCFSNEKTNMKESSLNHFKNPNQVETDDKEQYFMLTFTFQ